MFSKIFRTIVKMTSNRKKIDSTEKIEENVTIKILTKKIYSRKSLINREAKVARTRHVIATTFLNSRTFDNSWVIWMLAEIVTKSNINNEIVSSFLKKFKWTRSKLFKKFRFRKRIVFCQKTWKFKKTRDVNCCDRES